GDADAFQTSLREGLRVLCLLCLPSAVGLAICAHPIIAVIYQHGRFDAADTHASAIALSAYALGLTGYAAIKILGPAFYALDDARTPMRVSALSVVINLACNWLAVRVLGLGHGGLALSTSVVALCNSALLFVMLRRKIGVRSLGLAADVRRIALATLVMAAVCALWLWAMGATPGFTRDLARVATTVPIGAVTFYAVGRALGLSDLEKLARRAKAVLG
ncbi:MAG TPA: lipid II flippase MurJ, partial [Candidatus Binatia bacterium]|nr:lipid II flippase MurJ [Candidatus Binatia bacterium]